MSLKNGNELFRLGRYEQAIETYSNIDKSSPLYQSAQFNIALARKIIERSKKRPIARRKNRCHKTFISDVKVGQLPVVKGIPIGDCLNAALGRLSNNHYYRVILSAELNNLPVIVSVRDGERNLPLYQNTVYDINIGEHIFIVPPSVNSEITFSLHPINNSLSIKELSEKILVTIECLGHSDEISFKPNGLIKPIIASMATIESRLNIAIDAAYSLLSQVDRVYVHINDMYVTPDAFHHERIIVTTEISHGNLGDAGKFVGSRIEGDAYTLVCDDDFIFPYDFILQSYLKLAQENFRAIIGMHGIFLRFPLDDYYAADARNTMHITTGFSFDTTVSVVGTGAVFFDSDIFPTENFVLDYKNMADIWFALECNRLGLPIYIQKRRTNWLIDNPPSNQANTIWNHSAINVVSEANTRAMQTFVLSAKQSYLCSRPLNSNFIGKDYILVLDFDIFKQALSIIECLSKTTYSPSIILIQGCIDLSEARTLVRTIYADVILQTEILSYSELKKKFSPYTHKFILQLTQSLEISEDIIKKLVDLFREAFIKLPTQLDIPIFFEPPRLNGLIRYIPKTRSNNKWIEKADARIVTTVVEDTLSLFVQSGTPQIEILTKTNKGFLQSINRDQVAIRFSEYFDQVYLLNMDRRPDRLEQFNKRASKWGISFKRVSAVDGSLEDNQRQYDAIQDRLKSLYGYLGHRFQYESSSYWEYKSEAERISHLLQKGGKTYSAGGYGYLKTYKSIIENAIEKGYDRIVVFDDDCLFHKNLDFLFSNLIQAIPDDWITISLGSLQYDWRDKHINWWAQNAYRCGGHSVGSHAQAYSKSALPMLLEYINRYTLPYDVGPLHYVKRYYSTKSFTAYPNLFIQDVTDTDIGDSSVQLSEGAKKENVYKWILSDYE